MSPSELIAKKRDDGMLQTFEGHITDSLLILQDYLIKNQEVLKRFSKNFKLDHDSLCNLLFLAVYLHDIGKLTEEFQQNIKVGKSCAYVSHAFFALPFIESDFHEDEMNIILKLTILSHHSQLYNQIFENAKLKNKVSYIKDEIKKHIDQSESAYEAYFSDIFSLKNKPIYREKEYISHSNLIRKIRRKELEHLKRRGYQKDERTKAIYCLTLAVLKHCDQKASKNFDKDGLITDRLNGSVIKRNFIDDINYNPNKIFNKDERDIIVDDEGIPLIPFRFQIDAKNNIDKYGIISAPCGRGKTEAALLAALDIIKEHKRNKIIFALPTQITSNAMYERLKKIFGDENVGLYHGMSRFVIDKNRKGKIVSDETIDEELEWKKTKSINYDFKVFEKAVVVTTVDHLIFSFVHGYKQADFALGNILNSVIIFDEIHYYEKRTLRYIIDCLKLLKKLDIPNIVMSGTLPRYIQDRLLEVNPEYENGMIEDNEGMDFTPFKIIKKEHSLDNNISHIRELYKNGKKQIVILNTIKRAFDIYNTLNERDAKEIVLYHSMFIQEDKLKKEEKIRRLDKSGKPYIIVSTQAIEISIDISCDVMHTEIAPIDAIGQRGGRLNRGGEKHNDEYLMYVYATEDHKPYYFNKINDDRIDFVEKTECIIESQTISYKLIRKWCDQVYNEECLNLRKTKLENVFKDCILFGRSVREVRGLSDEDDGNMIKLRENNYLRIDVIPKQVYKKMGGKKVLDSPRLPLYLVKVPYWWITNSLDKDLNQFEVVEENKYQRKYWICKIPYTNKNGFDIDKLGETFEDLDGHTKFC